MPPPHRCQHPADHPARGARAPQPRRPPAQHLPAPGPRGALLASHAHLLGVPGLLRAQRASLSHRQPTVRTQHLRPGFSILLFALSAGAGGTAGLFLAQTSVPVSSRTWLWGPGGAPRVHLLGSGRGPAGAPPRACTRPAPRTGAPVRRSRLRRQEAESVPGRLSCPIASLPVTGRHHAVFTSRAYILQHSGLP